MSNSDSNGSPTNPFSSFEYMFRNIQPPTGRVNAHIGRYRLNDILLVGRTDMMLAPQGEEDVNDVQRNALNQFQENVNGTYDSLTMFFNFAESGSPYNGTSVSSLHVRLVDVIEECKVLLDNLRGYDKDSFMAEWCSYFISTRVSLTEEIVTQTCCVCYETVSSGYTPCASKGSNDATNDHIMCMTCLLEHYWESTEGLTKSESQCPLCRAPFKLTSFIK